MGVSSWWGVLSLAHILTASHDDLMTAPGCRPGGASTPEHPPVGHPRPIAVVNRGDMEDRLPSIARITPSGFSR
jgi:hypothetical protein